MKLDNITQVYFIGIGGIGMSAIARYFSYRGCVVYGYDKTRSSLCEQLENEGMEISYADDLTSLPSLFLEPNEQTLIIYTPAIPSNSELLRYFIDGGFHVLKRSQVLGVISQDSFCIAIAGTHGKTTTSAMVAHILTHTGFGCNAFLGGILSNYNSNYLFHKNKVVVVEADEYDRSFLTLSPDLSVITSMDADHLDIYGDASELIATFKEFAKKLKTKGKLFKRAGLPIEGGDSYAFSAPAKHYAQNIKAIEGAFVFDYVDESNIIEGIRLSLPGNHNVENAVAAISIAIHLGIDTWKIKEAVEAFLGVKRRFQLVLATKAHVVIDDYAHHPEELRACISAVKMLYPNKKLTVAFQPHLFTRTRDFADGFADVLTDANHLILLDIYPARELPIAGVTSSFLLEKIGDTEKEICSLENLEKRIGQLKPELLLLVGAGNIDTKVEPIKNLLNYA